MPSQELAQYQGYSCLVRAKSVQDLPNAKIFIHIVIQFL